MTDLQYATIIMIILFAILCALIVVDIVVNLMQYRHRRHVHSKPRTIMPPKYVPRIEGE